MKTKNSATMLAFVSALFIGGATRAADAGKKPDASKATAVSVNADEIKWGDAPPDLPKGARSRCCTAIRPEGACSRCASRCPTGTRSRRTGTPRTSS